VDPLHKVNKIHDIIWEVEHVTGQSSTISQQQNSFNLAPHNLALLTLQHLKKVVPRQEVLLSITCGGIGLLIL